MSTTNPNYDPQIPDWVLRSHEEIMNPPPGDPILGKAESPRLEHLQRWRTDAVRYGFDPAEVYLVFDGECYGIRVPEALVDRRMDEFWK